MNFYSTESYIDIVKETDIHMEINCAKLRKPTNYCVENAFSTKISVDYTYTSNKAILVL